MDVQIDSLWINNGLFIRVQGQKHKVFEPEHVFLVDFGHLVFLKVLLVNSERTALSLFMTQILSPDGLHLFYLTES